MTEDQLSYKRATSVSLVGLTIQLSVAIVLFFYARFGQDPAAMTGFWAVLLGVPAWLGLALVFHQHRLERLESLEADAYRTSGAAQASVFEEAGVDELVQVAKLAWMHRWFLPGISIVLGLSYMLLGLFRYFHTREFTDIDAFVAAHETGWAISISAGIAVIGFVFARFVAGMAKQQVWALLHAGSAAAVGAALIAAMIGVSHFLRIAIGYELLQRYLPSILAIFMIAMGFETFLNFLLNLYRPRRAGEFQRPAFDSRVLAFAAAPDRLAESISEAVNYQFGFNVSSTWFYRLLQRSIGALGVLGILIIWGMSCFAIVEPHEKGLLIRKGDLVRELDSGLTLKMPWPLSRVEKFPARAVNEIVVGSPQSTGEGPILWTNKHAGNETMFLVRPTSDSRDDERTNPADFALLVAEIPIHFTVKDLVAYVRFAQDGRRGDRDRIRHELLEALASRAIMEYMATLDVDQILGSDRSGMAQTIRRIIQTSYDNANAGVTVLFAGVAEVHPMDEVAKSFEQVVGADQRRITEIEAARSEEIAILAQSAGSVESARTVLTALDDLDELRRSGGDDEAIILAEQHVLDLIVTGGGEAADIVSRARTQRWEAHMSARATLVASEGQVAAYRAAPAPFLMGTWLAALTQAASRARVFIVPRDNVRIDVEYEEIDPIIGGFGGFEEDIGNGP